MSKSSNDFSGYGIVVTGRGRGIGEAITRFFASRGSGVVILDLSSVAVGVVDEINKNGGRAWSISCDVSNSQEVEGASDEVNQYLGSLDVLVNNAEISIDQGIRRLTDEAWSKTIAINMNGVVFCSQQSLKILLMQLCFSLARTRNLLPAKY